MFLIKDDKNLLKEVGLSKSDINFLSLEFKNILLDEYENYLDYKKDQKAAIEQFVNK